MIHKRHLNYINYIRKISAHIIAVSLYENPKLIIISVYSPTNIAKDEEKEAFYDDLENFIHNLPPHDCVLVAGDFNARIGFDTHYNSPQIISGNVFHEFTNDNGFRLTTLCESSSLKPAQFKFPHPKNRLWTWMHPKGTKAQIDHILISCKWANSLRNCRSYSSVELDSDHRIVTATIKLSFLVLAKDSTKLILLIGISYPKINVFNLDTPFISGTISTYWMKYLIIHKLIMTLLLNVFQR